MYDPRFPEIETEETQKAQQRTQAPKRSNYIVPIILIAALVLLAASLTLIKPAAAPTTVLPKQQEVVEPAQPAQSTVPAATTAPQVFSNDIQVDTAMKNASLVNAVKSIRPNIAEGFSEKDPVALALASGATVISQPGNDVGNVNDAVNCPANVDISRQLVPMEMKIPAGLTYGSPFSSSISVSDQLLLMLQHGSLLTVAVSQDIVNLTPAQLDQVIAVEANWFKCAAGVSPLANNKRGFMITELLDYADNSARPNNRSGILRAAYALCGSDAEREAVTELAAKYGVPVQ